MLTDVAIKLNVSGSEGVGGGSLDIFSLITKFLKLVIKIVIKNTSENNFSSSREVQ